MKDIYKNNIREFTTKEVAQALGYSSSGIINLANRKGVKYKTIKTTTGKCSIFSYTEYQQLKKYVEERREIIAKFNKLNLANLPTLPASPSSEDIKLAHPLVIDERFLRLDFFPDVTPKCFENIDSEVIA